MYSRDALDKESLFELQDEQFPNCALITSSPDNTKSTLINFFNGERVDCKAGEKNEFHAGRNSGLYLKIASLSLAKRRKLEYDGIGGYKKIGFGFISVRERVENLIRKEISDKEMRENELLRIEEAYRRVDSQTRNFIGRKKANAVGGKRKRSQN